MSEELEDARQRYANDTAREILQLRADVSRLREALLTMRNYALATAHYWDRDEDMKTGKRLWAMGGRGRGYDAEIDAVHKLIDEVREVTNG